ncbi:hypothetical protein N9Q22_00305 [bacterium]|nr:hypothetical protein [bacterium]
MNIKYILILFFISIQFTNAQVTKNNKLYASSELSIGNYLGVDVNLNMITKKNYIFKVGFNGNFRSSRSTPSDYVDIMDPTLFAGPRDYFNSFQIGFGKLYNIGKIENLDENGIVRANISFGLGITTLKERVNWRLNNNSFLYYISDGKRYSTISLIINPKIEFPFKKFLGLTISPMIQINKYRTYFGIGIGQMIGLVR